MADGAGAPVVPGGRELDRGERSGRAPEALRWADLALHQRAHWTGDTLRGRVRTLAKVRAVTSQAAWQAVEQAHAAEPSAETRRRADQWRDATREAAHTWARELGADGSDPSAAVSLCVAAGGTEPGCRPAAGP